MSQCRHKACFREKDGSGPGHPQAVMFKVTYQEKR